MKKILNNKIAMFALAVLAIVATYVLFLTPPDGVAMLAAFPMIMKIGDMDYTIKTQEDKDQMDDLLKIMNAITAKAVAGFITAQDAAQKIADKIAEHKFKIEDEPKFKEYTERVIKLAQEVTALKEQPAGTERKSFGRQIAEYVQANKEKFDAIVKTEGKIGFELKNAASILTSTHVTGTASSTYREPSITDVAREQRFIMDVIGTTTIGLPVYEWIEKKNPDGTVAFVLDTEAYAQIDFDLDVNSMTAKDVGGFITVHENMLDDVDGLAAEIDRELVYQIKKAADAEILSGVGTTSHLKGLTVYAVAGFSLTSISVASPTIWDAVSAAIRQVELVGFDQATFIEMNPADYENALGEKDSQGRYVGHPSLSPDGTRFAGIPIDRTSFVTAGNILVGNKMTSQIKVYKDIEMAIGYNLTGEFAKRHITIRGGMRLMHVVKDNHVGSWVYDSIDDIKAAITKV